MEWKGGEEGRGEEGGRVWRSEEIEGGIEMGGRERTDIREILPKICRCDCCYDNAVQRSRSEHRMSYHAEAKRGMLPSAN